ncbi:MAG: hypothetical protein RL338_1743 [Chloroflexota bacterium]
MTHRAGAAAIPITPRLAGPDGTPTLLAGFWPPRPATGVHSPLEVRALALATPDGPPVVIVVADLVGLPRGLVLSARLAIEGAATGARAILAATHVHSGPDTIGLWGPDDATSGVDPAYLGRVEAAVVAAARAAIAALVPVGLEAAAIRVPGVARNARQPAIVDDELTILRAVGADGRTVATFLDFPCHPEVLDGSTTLVSADYPGALRERVEAALGGTAVFAAGALGAMMTPARDEPTVAELERAGARLADAALAALAGEARRLGPGLRFDRRPIAIPSENPVFEGALAAGIVAPRERTASGAITSDVSLVEIGGPAGLRLAAVPGELAPTLGLPLKAALAPALTAIVGLADDELGYFLDPADFVFPDDPRAPGEHYEETMSVGREAGPVVADAIRSLLATEAAGATATGGAP